jgi:hypothetical protein
MSKGSNKFHDKISIHDIGFSINDLERFACELYLEECLESDCLEYHEDGCGNCPLSCFIKSLDIWRKEDETEVLEELGF